MSIGCTTLFCTTIVGIINFIDFVIPVLAGVAVALFMWSMVRYIYQAGNAKQKHGSRQGMLWGLATLFFLFSIWGILKILDNSFFGGSAGAPAGTPLDIRPSAATDPWKGLR